MNPILWLITTIIHLYFIIVIAQVIYSWLVHFNILNRYQPFVQQLGVFFEKLTAPAYRVIRRYVPPLAGLDLSPIILLIGLQFLERLVLWVAGY